MRADPSDLPSNFLFGAASSAYQIWEFLSKINVEAESGSEPILQRLDSMEERDARQFQLL
ncbi:hypothetical protein Ancab_023361 [Ancistrocladus abbreviatus]